jgi:hypothetical protein
MELLYGQQELELLKNPPQKGRKECEAFIDCPPRSHRKAEDDEENEDDDEKLRSY